VTPTNPLWHEFDVNVKCEESEVEVQMARMRAKLQKKWESSSIKKKKKEKELQQNWLVRNNQFNNENSTIPSSQTWLYARKDTVSHCITYIDFIVQ